MTIAKTKKKKKEMNLRCIFADCELPSDCSSQTYSSWLRLIKILIYFFPWSSLVVDNFFLSISLYFSFACSFSFPFWWLRMGNMRTRICNAFFTFCFWCEQNNHSEIRSERDRENPSLRRTSENCVLRRKCSQFIHSIFASFILKTHCVFVICSGFHIKCFFLSLILFLSFLCARSRTSTGNLNFIGNNELTN